MPPVRSSDLAATHNTAEKHLRNDWGKLHKVTMARKTIRDMYPRGSRYQAIKDLGPKSQNNHGL